MQSFNRSVFRAAKFTARNFSAASPEAARAESLRWMNISKGMGGLCFVVAAYCFVVHDHAHQRTDMTYFKIRSKAFPWRECSDCALLDPTCWKKCRGEEVEEHH